jgi:CheY-like chemotaxis protein
MDVRMPGLDGIETNKRVRNLDFFKDIPIIGISANAYKEDIDVAMEADMNDYLMKPIDKILLEEKLIQYLN